MESVNERAALVLYWLVVELASDLEIAPRVAKDTLLLIHHVEECLFSQMLLSLIWIPYQPCRNVSSSMSRILNE